MMSIRTEILDELLKDYKSPEDLIGKEGLLEDLKKSLLNRVLEGEMTHHIGYKKNGRSREETNNRRNGKTKKRVKTRDGEIEIEVPRDRESKFEPMVVKKHQRRFNGFDEKIMSMYARGMTVREIQGYLKEIYGTEVSPDLISTVRDAVMEEVRAWQKRPLDGIYPIVYLDAIRIKERDEGKSKTRHFIWLWELTWTDKKKCWGYGCRKTKEPDSGCQ